MAKKFKPWKAIKKGLVAAAAVGAGLVAGAATLGNVSSLKQAGAVAVISAAVAGIRAGMNWYKVNADLADKVPPR
jgi:hypothetical protein